MRVPMFICTEYEGLYDLQAASLETRVSAPIHISTGQFSSVAVSM